MENKNKVLVCAECGSSDVHTQAWVAVNENNVCCGIFGTDDRSNNWCCSCEEEVHLITCKEWKKQQEE